MSVLEGKHIIVGISGGIAAYKTPLLIRLLVQKGADVKVVVSKNALEFVTPLTLQTVSKHPIYKDMFGEWVETTTEHVSLAKWADCVIVAPTSADVIGKYANGIADDCLSTTLLAFEKTVFLCPAMNTAMYYNFSVRKNLAFLSQNGVQIIDSESGELACGVSGKGRMEEIDKIVERVENYFAGETDTTKSINQHATEQDITEDFLDKVITITAGPTRESIDSVRYISNNSSGRMGVEIAKEFVSRGAKVNLILGPVSIEVPKSERLNIVNVLSAEDMYQKAIEYAEKSSIIVCSAAVADYTTKEKHIGKIKKKEDIIHLDLVPTKDILKELGKRKTPSQILVGFALETDNEEDNAKEKLKKKNLDFIVLNSLNDKGAGFEHSTNKVTIIDKNNRIEKYPLKSKTLVARDIVNKVKDFF